MKKVVRNTFCRSAEDADRWDAVGSKFSNDAECFVGGAIITDMQLPVWVTLRLEGVQLLRDVRCALVRRQEYMNGRL